MSKEEYRPQQSLQPEAKPQDSLERQPLPNVLDILERRAQLHEDWERVSKQLGPKSTRARNARYVEYLEKRYDLGQELKAVHDLGTDPRERLIIDMYTTMAKFESGERVRWDRDLTLPEQTRRFITRVAPMSEEELREELRKAQETLERKTQANRKRQENRIRQKGLTYGERHENLLERGRQRYHARKEQRRLQSEQQQPEQVFPPPTKE